jgi:hypothetical protein
MVSAYTSGSPQVQVSPDGSSWVNFGAPISAVGVIAVPVACAAIRVHSPAAVVATAFVTGSLPTD